MIEKDLIGWISKKLQIPDLKLIEKDLYLQGLLLAFEKREHFAKNFVFKGGTCLTKAYFGYYRFSEDLDFTWVNWESFENKSEKQIRKLLSIEIDKLMELFVGLAKELGLDFKPEKSNKNYVQLGGSNKFVAFKFWYLPVNEEKKDFIKIQLNFAEVLSYPIVKRELKPIAPEYKKDLAFLYPACAKFAFQSANLNVYSLDEITAEKVRALLTRRSFKARDIIDLYMLSKKGITIDSVKNVAIKKTLFMLKYSKYDVNLKNKKFEGVYSIGDEEELMLKPLGNDFEKFAKDVFNELDILVYEVKKRQIKG
jgi:predicted nucleotidyltransferase component of viral defense system